MNSTYAAQPSDAVYGRLELCRLGYRGRRRMTRRCAMSGEPVSNVHSPPVAPQCQESHA